MKLNTMQMSFMKNELCILVNKLDQKIGTDTKYNCHLVEKGLPLHRAFSLFLYHKNKLLLQQRSAFKATWPLKFTNSCCSHPLFINGKEESITDAIKRKTMHELGIIPKNLEFKGRIIYTAQETKFGEYEFDHIYTGTVDSIDIPFNKDEVNSIKWISKNDELVDEDFTPWFNIIKKYNNLFDMRPWHNVIVHNSKSNHCV